MESLILASVKESVNVEPGLDAFDETLLGHINTAFGSLYQLGVGPEGGFELDDGTETWEQFIDASEEGGGNKNLLNLSKAYITLQVRMLFDPPQVGFLLTTIEKQIDRLEWRLSEMREEDIYEPDFDTVA